MRSSKSPQREENMRTITTLKQSLSPLLQPIHSFRVNSVFWAVSSLLFGGRLSLTAIGRSGAGTSLTKHAIKRADRLLGNTKLHKELPTFYKAIAHQLLLNCQRPIILVDWTRIEPKHVALVAAVALGGRSIPIYAEVHSQRKDSNPEVMRQFLVTLKTQIVPASCKPIIVTDAGFRNKWFRSVLNLGWD